MGLPPDVVALAGFMRILTTGFVRRLKRTVTMAMARSKTRGKAVSTVAQEIERMVAEMAQEGMWRPGLRARRA